MDIRLYKLLLLSTLILVFGSPRAIAEAEVSLVASDQSGVHLVVSIDPETLESAEESDSLPGYFQLLTVGIPYGAQVEVLSADVRSRSTVPFLNTSGHKLSSISRPLVEVSEPWMVRDRQMVTVRINPVTSGGACYDSLDIRLAFRGGVTDGIAPRDPWFDRVFGRRMVNFDEYRTWPVPAQAMTKQVVDGPFAGNKTWYKIAVNRTGLCRVTGSQLQQAGLSLTGLSSDALCLYSAGGRKLSVATSIARPEFRQVAILVEDGGDGIFDPADQILFFAEAVDRWVYDPGATPKFVNHPYDTENTYWLTIQDGAGLRMTTTPVNPTGAFDTTITTFTRLLHVEQDHLLREDARGATLDYYDWYWSSDSMVQISVPTQGHVPATPAELVCIAETRDPDFTDPAVGYIRAWVNNVTATPVIVNQNQGRFTVGNLNDGLNDIRLRMWGAYGIAPYLDYVELTWQSYLMPQAAVLDLPLGGIAAMARVEVIDNFNGSVIGLRLDNPGRPELLTGFDRSSGLVTLAAPLTAEGPNRFYFSETAAAFGPLAIEPATPTDLYAIGGQVDLIIVTASRLAPAMSEYVELREQAGMSTRLVTVEDIMENFGFGLYDPSAIRDYLKYAYENYPSPSPYTVLLAGDGTYDYTNALGLDIPNVVPPYIRPDDESCADDNYVYFGRYGILDSDTSYIQVPDRGLDMVAARWPVQTASEIYTIVEKSRRYQSPATFGLWRSVLTVVADDEIGRRVDETFHVEQAEELVRSHVPGTLHRKKIYLYDFPRVGREKPAANDAIVRQVNDGTVLVNYVGHGNPDVWADEHVFSRDGDLPRLSNSGRLPLFYAASCTIGAFDDPTREAMGEELLVYPNGGGIAVIAAMREVYATPNADLNRKVFDIMLTTDSLSMAEALYMAKLERQYGTGTVPMWQSNDRRYQFFGDPTLPLGLPRLRIEFTKSPDSLMALSRTHITGRIVDRDGLPVVVDGRLIIEAYDSERERRHVIADGTTVSYNLTGPTIYRGTATVSGGAFEFAFVTPLDVGYGGQGAQIMAYAELSGADGVGVIDSLTISEAVDTTGADQTGPTIAYDFPNVAGFADGGTVTREDVLRITLTDSSGINLTGGLGHGITLILDDQPEKMIDLTGLFACDQDDFTRGQLDYRIEDLEPGRHSFKIKAWDNANNSSTATFSATVAASGGPVLVDLLNYPNPMRERTVFSYRTMAEVRRVQVEIFTLSGRKIWSGEHFPTDPGFYDDIEWYGTDYAGDRVATGVYVYKATAFPESGAAVESFGKVVVVN